MPPRKKITILDGGMSRELMRLNAPFKQPEWSALALIEAPHFVFQVHKDFIAAGADVITTNSYAVVPFHIGEERFWSDGGRLAALSGRLAREAANEANKTRKKSDRVKVAGCLPPIFGSYRPDLFDSKNANKYLEVLVRALNPYVDVWLAETLSSSSEADAALKATEHTRKPFWVSFTLDEHMLDDDKVDDLRKRESLVALTDWAFSRGVDALMFNCARPEYMQWAITAYNTVSARSMYRGDRHPVFGIYANAFKPRAKEYAANSDVSATDEDLDPQAYCEFASRWVDHGAGIIGGCCGVGHEHIKALTQAFKTTDHSRL